jgi:hypothetical protein
MPHTKNRKIAKAKKSEKRNQLEKTKRCNNSGVSVDDADGDEAQDSTN